MGAKKPEQIKFEYILSPILGEELGIKVESRLIWLIAISLFLFLYWSSITNIAEVAVAQGRVLPVANIRKIEHPDGGTVSRVHVKNGDKVKQGSVLVEFDGVLIEADIDQAEKQISTIKHKLDLLKSDLKTRSELVSKGYQSKLDLNDKISLEAEYKGQIQELKGNIKRLNLRLSQLVLRAPIDGVVNNLKVDGASSVVKAQETVMEIVPANYKLIAEIDVSPRDIGHIKLNQNVTLKFVSFDYAQYGGIYGVITYVSPNSYISPEGRPYYRALATFEKAHIGSNPSQNNIISGMSFQADIATGSKTLLQYMIKPIYSSARTAFQER